MIATNLEQSKRLLELGLPASTADMTWSASGNMLMVHTSSKRGTKELHAWSLTALLNLIPMVDLYVMPSGGYMCTSFYKNGSHKHFAETPIEAAYEMVCWLLRNNLIKKGDNDE